MNCNFLWPLEIHNSKYILATNFIFLSILIYLCEVISCYAAYSVQANPIALSLSRRKTSGSTVGSPCCDEL